MHCGYKVFVKSSFNQKLEGLLEVRRYSRFVAISLLEHFHITTRANKDLFENVGVSLSILKASCHPM